MKKYKVFPAILFFVVVGIFSLFVVSCNNDSKENLSPEITSSCDTTNISYSGSISLC